MSDIKMSDAFSGELKLRTIDSDDFSDASCNESFFVIEDDSYWCCSSENHINHAIHAINSHDKLTEQNKMMREALVKVVSADSFHYQDDAEFAEAINHAKDILEQTKC